MNSSFAESLIILQNEQPEAYHDFIDIIKTGESKKGETLISINSICKHVYLIQSGLVRHYKYDEEGKEFSCWFSFEGDIVLPAASLIPKSPSKKGVEVLEDCTYSYVRYDQLYQLTQKHHAIETMYLRLLELYYIEKDERLYRIQAYTAEKKYNYLLTSKPHFLDKISQLHIASYLGISRETLSRIKSKHRKP